MAEMDMREKLVELLADSVYENVELDDGYVGYEVNNEQIADYLIAKGVTVQEWISVTERLPKPYVDVVVCRHDLLGRANTVGLEYITITHDEIPVWSKDYMTWKSKVSHWMPLPEAPKGE